MRKERERKNCVCIVGVFHREVHFSPAYRILGGIDLFSLAVKWMGSEPAEQTERRRKNESQLSYSLLLSSPLFFFSFFLFGLLVFFRCCFFCIPAAAFFLLQVQDEGLSNIGLTYFTDHPCLFLFLFYLSSDRNWKKVLWINEIESSYLWRPHRDFFTFTFITKTIIQYFKKPRSPLWI